ncbi:MAG: hypothetical protein HY039_02350 [Nitrospirae bacterium]|nr:hypothetical protein [Nitrospirota bacterium]
MLKNMNHKPIDAAGKRIRVGDIVRIVGVPDLKGMKPKYRRESMPVFKYLVGKYKKVEEFDHNGQAWLTFIIRKGPNRGIHSVGIEPYLLRVRRPSVFMDHIMSGGKGTNASDENSPEWARILRASRRTKR